MAKRGICLTISYDGANYYGWQYQSDFPTVQDEMEKALRKMLGEQIRVHGAGRTDAKAHAFAYVCHFHCENQSVPEHKFIPALNSLLPGDVRVLSSHEVSLEFHSRFSAVAREYVYLMYCGKRSLPMFRNYAHLLDYSPELERLREATGLFTGEHDFRQFCYGYGEEPEKNFVRRVYYFRVIRMGDWAVFFIKGNGFLQGMIRTLVGVCLRCEQGKISLDAIKKALDGGKELHSKHKVAVPAEGLYFKRAYY